MLKTTSSHEEGCNRRWLLNTNRFIGKDGCVTGAEVEEISWTEPKDGERPTMIRSGKTEIIPCDMVLLAMGFIRPQHPQLPEGVFVAGDAASGASLVVKAMANAHQVAKKVDEYLSR